MKEEMNMDEFQKRAAELIRQGKPLTGEGGIFTPLIKQVLEAAMEGEMDAHLSEIKANTKNRRNGHSKKQMKSSMGSFELKTPRDREGSFTPESVPKRQTQLPGDLDEKILGLYGLGMSYNDIQAHFREMYVPNR